MRGMVESGFDEPVSAQAMARKRVQAREAMEERVSAWRKGRDRGRNHDIEM